MLGAGAVLAIVAAATSMAADAPSRDAVRGGANLALGGNDPALGDAGELAHGRFGRHGFGEITITAISGNAVTLGTPDGWSRTITITDTVDLTKGGQDIAVSDLKVGDQVRFSQTRNADGTYTVTAVAVVVPTVQGTASAITSTGFKVTTRDGSVWTVTVNGSTTYTYGQGTGTLADVKDGQAVRVQGTTTADNQITALNVRVAGDRAVGTVTAKTADTITIKRRDGSSLTIHVDADTTYRVAGVDNADLGDITVDMGDRRRRGAHAPTARSMPMRSRPAKVSAGTAAAAGARAAWTGPASSCRTRPTRSSRETSGSRPPERNASALEGPPHLPSTEVRRARWYPARMDVAFGHGPRGRIRLGPARPEPSRSSCRSRSTTCCRSTGSVWAVCVDARCSTWPAGARHSSRGGSSRRRSTDAALAAPRGVASPAGFEPATLRLEGACSVH